MDYIAHAWGIKRGGQAKNHKYYAREGSPGHYIYYYTREEYMAAKNRGGNVFKRRTGLQNIGAKLYSRSQKVGDKVVSGTRKIQAVARNTGAKLYTKSQQIGDRVVSGVDLTVQKIREKNREIKKDVAALTKINLKKEIESVKEAFVTKKDDAKKNEIIVGLKNRKDYLDKKINDFIQNNSSVPISIASTKFLGQVVPYIVTTTEQDRIDNYAKRREEKAKITEQNINSVIKKVNEKTSSSLMADYIIPFFKMTNQEIAIIFEGLNALTSRPINSSNTTTTINKNDDESFIDRIFKNKLSEIINKYIKVR